MRQNIIFHIGYPKSASTTLQKHLFQKHPEINNLGIYPTSNIGIDTNVVDNNCVYLRDNNLYDFYCNLVMLPSIDYFYSDNINLFEKYIKKYLCKDKINVFSNERVASVYFSHDDVKVKADRLKEIFPNAKILIIIRNQLDLIKSQYRDHPFDPRNLSIGKPVSLHKWIEIALNYDSVYFLNSLKYYELINYYANLFGKNNINIMLFEELVQSPEIFSEKMSEIMNIDKSTTYEILKNKWENHSVSKKYNMYRKVRRNLKIKCIGKYLPMSLKDKLLNNLKKGGREKLYISNYLYDQLCNYYSESNKKLQNEFNVKLKEYGYII
ncbi:MAG: sulfotransferase [Clostridiales bacterium]|nr:sulfotransferase [Clostridiales bacterium]MCF8023163.1 sulfotransferase [Clostridiales bacterium]